MSRRLGEIVVLPFQSSHRSGLPPLSERKEGESMLDINLFREENGNNPEIIRESQRRRFANVEIVDEIIGLDKECRQRENDLEVLPELYNGINIDLAAKLGIDKESAFSITRGSQKYITAKKTVEVQEARAALYSKLELVGNLVRDSVPVSNDEANNAVVRTWEREELGQIYKTTATKRAKHTHFIDNSRAQL